MKMPVERPVTNLALRETCCVPMPGSTIIRWLVHLCVCMGIGALSNQLSWHWTVLFLWWITGLAKFQVSLFPTGQSTSYKYKPQTIKCLQQNWDNKEVWGVESETHQCLTTQTVWLTIIKAMKNQWKTRRYQAMHHTLQQFPYLYYLVHHLQKALSLSMHVELFLNRKQTSFNRSCLFSDCPLGFVFASTGATLILIVRVVLNVCQYQWIKLYTHCSKDTIKNFHHPQTTHSMQYLVSSSTPTTGHVFHH